MRRGFKIFDSDTHLNPMAETLEPYSNRCYDQIGISDYLVRRLRQITSLRRRCFTCHYRYR